MNGVNNQSQSIMTRMRTASTYSTSRPTIQFPSFNQPQQQMNQNFSFGNSFSASSNPAMGSLFGILNQLTSMLGGQSTPAPVAQAPAPVAQAPANTFNFSGIAASAPSAVAPMAVMSAPAASAQPDTSNILTTLFSALFGGNLFGGASASSAASVAPVAPFGGNYNTGSQVFGGGATNVFGASSFGMQQTQQQPSMQFGMNMQQQPAMQFGMNMQQQPAMQFGMNMQQQPMQQQPAMQAGMMGMMGEGDAGVGPGQGHDFLSHVRMKYPELVAKGQSQFGGFTQINSNTFVARSPITGMQPVIDQAIGDIIKSAANRNLDIDKLESKVALRLTQLNDFRVLTTDTKERIEDVTGIDFSGMSTAEREESINHLLHSPLPFGNITQIMSPNQRIDMGYTHTLDKDKTIAQDMGNGLFKIKMISNNNNGSHTGHNLGSFMVRLAPGMTLGEAKDFGNRMIVNTNDNNKLYLSEVAREQLMDALAAY